MKVVLVKNVEDLGEKYEIKEVAGGYARNYLLPQRLAKMANKKNIKWARDMQRKKREQARKELEKMEEISSQLEKEEIEMKVKVGEKDQLFEEINASKIAERLNALDYKKVEADHIKLEEPIKEPGEYSIKIELPHNLETEITLLVEEEEED